MTSETVYERYQRQILLREFGLQGQQKLLQSKVLVIGAGGLGCPVLQYLVAAGVGMIGIADDDIVSLNNLHRQVLFAVNDIGSSKAITAKEKLQNLNPEIKIIAYNVRLSVSNALEVLENYDIVVDGTDNFSTRYMINDACVMLDKPLIYGAVSKFEGQVAIFNCKQNTVEVPVNYRDLFPHPPKQDEVPNCEEAGVLGVLPGIIGTMMASETIKLITGIGTVLINRMLTYNALNNQFYEFELNANQETQRLIPVDAEAFEAMNYEALCSSDVALRFEIDAGMFEKMIHTKNIKIIDVREIGETPPIAEFEFLQIPLSKLKNNMPVINEDSVITFCQSGSRSLLAAQLLFKTYGETKNIFSLKDGILSWKKLHQQQST